MSYTLPTVEEQTYLLYENGVLVEYETDGLDTVKTGETEEVDTSDALGVVNEAMDLLTSGTKSRLTALRSHLNRYQEVTIDAQSASDYIATLVEVGEDAEITDQDVLDFLNHFVSDDFEEGSLMTKSELQVLQIECEKVLNTYDNTLDEYKTEISTLNTEFTTLLSAWQSIISEIQKSLSNAADKAGG